MGGVVAVPYEPSASSSQVLVPTPAGSNSAAQPATAPPEPDLAGGKPASFQQGN